MSGKFCFTTISLRFLDKAKIYAATLERQFPIYCFGKIFEFVFSKGVGSGVGYSLHFKFKRSGGVDFTPFFSKELELDFTPKIKE